MGNKLIISTKNIKRLFVCLVLLMIGLTLSSCDSSNRKPQGTLNRDETYLTAGNYSVTVGEVYDELRYSASEKLEEKISEILLADELATLKEDLESAESKYKEKLEEKILIDIYGSSKDEKIAELSEKTKEHKVTEFLSSLLQKGYILTEDDVENRNFASIYPLYYIDMAKYILAYNKLADEFGKEADGSIKFGDLEAEDAKISRDDVIDYYKENYKNHGDVTGILIRFASSSEATSALKTFGITSYQSKWYQIELTEDGDINPYDSRVKYEEYYEDNKTVDPTSGLASIEIKGAGMSTILKVYAALYNYIYPYRTPINFDNELTFAAFAATYPEDSPAHLLYYNYLKAIIDKDALFKENATDEQLEERYDELVHVLEEYETGEEYTVLSYDRLENYNSSLREYVYETLKTSSTDGEAYSQYVVSSLSYGNYSYLFFKAAQDADPELYTETKDGDKVTYTFTNEELKLEILNKLFENKLTDTYIPEAFEGRIKDAKIYIYDSVLELEFMQGDSTLATNYQATKKSNKENVAMVKLNKVEKYISVADLFNSLEPLNGPQTAVRLAFNKYIKAQQYYKDLEKNRDKYEETVKVLLNYFSNDYYSSSGYPATVGKFKFLRLIYHTANMDEIIHNVLMLNEAKNIFFSNYQNFFNEDEFLNNLVAYAHQAYEDYYSLNATKIKIYTDHNEDGKADDLDQESPLYPLALDLMNEVLDYASRSSSAYQTAITGFITEYNNTNRYADATNPTSSEYKWALYRQNGLYITTEALTSITADSDLDIETIERVHDLYNQESIMNPENGFVSNVLTSDSYLASNNLTTLLLTGGTNRTSAKYDDEEMIEKLYSEIPTIYQDKLIINNLTKEDFANDEANKNLVKVYLYDYLLSSSVTSLPASTTSALNAYLLPLIQRYTSTVSQFIMMENTLGALTFNYSAACTCGNEAYNNAYTRTNSVENYVQYLIDSLTDFNDKYPTWWDNMYTAIKGAN